MRTPFEDSGVPPNYGYLIDGGALGGIEFARNFRRRLGL